MFKKIISTTVICLSFLSISSLAVSEDEMKMKMNMYMPGMLPDIVDTSVKLGFFTTLLTAIDAADLAVVLKHEGPFTVFAPTDEAFAKLPAGTLEMLLKPENKDKLASILNYHVVSGIYRSSRIAELNTAQTVNGQELSIKVVGEDLKINGSVVTLANVGASNGIIHVIDTVLLPE